MFKNNSNQGPSEEEEKFMLTNQMLRVLQKERNKDIPSLLFVSLGDEDYFKLKWSKNNENLMMLASHTYENEHNGSYSLFSELDNDSMSNSDMSHIDDDDLMIKE